MKAEEYQELKEVLSGWPVKIVSYKVGDRYHVAIHNEEPGAWITKKQGATLDSARELARKDAAAALEKTRRIKPVAGCAA